MHPTSRHPRILCLVIHELVVLSFASLVSRNLRVARLSGIVSSLSLFASRSSPCLHLLRVVICGSYFSSSSSRSFHNLRVVRLIVRESSVSSSASRSSSGCRNAGFAFLSSPVIVLEGAGVCARMVFRGVKIKLCFLVCFCAGLRKSLNFRKKKLDFCFSR